MFLLDTTYNTPSHGIVKPPDMLLMWSGRLAGAVDAFEPGDSSTDDRYSVCSPSSSGDHYRGM